jgi:hypothetical protein
VIGYRHLPHQFLEVQNVHALQFDDVHFVVVAFGRHRAPFTRDDTGHTPDLGLPDGQL